MKQLVMVKKSDNTVVNNRVYSCENNIVGAVDGILTKNWYWCDVTGSEYIVDEEFTKTTRTPPEGETIDADAENVVKTGGTWA
jgi:hypothetical protein